MGTTHGERLVAKFLPRKGPRGWASQDWMSRADQSLSRERPKRWRSASAIGMGVAEGVACADVGGDFQLVVELRGGGEGGGGVAGELELAVGAADGRAADDEGRGSAVIADGEPVVVGKQWLVGAEELADVGGVMDGGVKVSVVLGGDGFVEDGLRHGEHEGGDQTLLIGVAVGAGLDGLEEIEEALAQSRPGGGTAAHQRVELRGGAGGLEVGREGYEEVVGLELVEVEDEGADAYAEVQHGFRRGRGFGHRCGRRCGREGAVWERLQGEAAGGLVGGADPGGGDAHVHEFMAWRQVVE